MSEVVRFLGSILVAVLFVFVPPVLLTLSFVCHWDGFAQLMLTGLALVQLGAVTDYVYRQADRE